MSDSKQKTDTVRLQTISRAFIQSATLNAAIDLGLFTQVARGHDTPAALSTAADISLANADRLMTMCSAMGLLELRGESYANAADVDRYLVEGREGYAAHWLQFLRKSWANWGQLAEKLQNRAPPQRLPSSVSNMTVDRAREYHAATSSIGFGAGRRFAKHVDLTGRRRLMDIGGGSGAYTIVAVQTYENLSGIVLDLPAVVEVTQEYIDSHGVADRVTTLGCDFTSHPLPEGCDIAVMASNLPMYNRDIIGEVVAKTFDALLPGGEMHLVGEMLDDDRRGPIDAAIWGLAEALSNSTGLSHTRNNCVGYFEAAGFESVEVNEFVPGILARVSGRKPA